MGETNRNVWKMENKVRKDCELKSKFWYICDVKSYVRKFKMLS